MSSDAIASESRIHRFVLLTDIARSSWLAENYPREYLAALERHNQLVEHTAERRDGLPYKQVGDGYFVLFETAGACLGAAAELGVAFGELEPLADDAPVQVRIALHAGGLQPSGKEYYGPALNRVSRICQVCNPGQVLLSGALAVLVESDDGRIRRSVLPDPEDIALGLQLHDLGLHQLRDLAEPEQLYQLDGAQFRQHEFPPLATLESRPNNLVRQPNHFIGREQELAELAAILEGDTNLLSVIAPGGYGKSRLAAQLCANLLQRFDNGVFMAYLAPVREPADVSMAIASALGYRFTSGSTPQQQLCDYLRNKDLLLCLDNFEHLLECAGLVAHLLQAAPLLKVIVTSREPLGLQGEQTYVLEPLALGSASGEYSDAELLFADRAMLVNRSFAISPDNGAQVQHFCEHLAGIPLAIELAAAWMDSFTLEELHDELTNQFDLEARKSDLAVRHQSLKACLDWSWNLLGPDQQEMLMRLSVFRGGFFSEAASSVLNLKGMALRRALARLADKSWLYSREVDRQTRFFLRDMLAHEYAYEKLQAHELFKSAVTAHAGYYAALVEREGPRLSGGGTPDDGAAQLCAMHTWHSELENINETLDQALQRGKTDWLLPIAQYLQAYLDTISSYFMLRDRYTLLLSAGQSLGQPALLAQCQLGLGRAHFRLGNHEAARSLLEQALAVSRESGDRQAELASLSSLARVHQVQDKYDQAAELHTRSLALCREIGDRQGAAAALGNLATIQLAQGEYDQAAELCSQSLDVCRAIGNRGGETGPLGNLATVHLILGRYDEAAELYSRSLEVCRELGDRRGEANLINNLAHLPYMKGEYARAAELYRRALAIRREIGDQQGEAFSLVNLGLVHHMLGESTESAELHNQALAICRETGNRGGEAYALGNLALVRYMLGEYSRAAELHSQSLEICREIGNRGGEAYSLVNLGTTCNAQGENYQASALYSQALAIFRELGSRAELALTSSCAAASLAALGSWRPAAVALYGGQFQLVALNHHVDPQTRNLADDAQAGLQAAVVSGAVSAGELEQWQAEGEAMSLDELAGFAQAELDQLQQDLGVVGRNE